MVNFGSENEFCDAITDNVPGMLYPSGQKIFKRLLARIRYLDWVLFSII